MCIRDSVKGGRCEACQGDGVIKIEMHFLPDVYVQCDSCNGKRYNRETLEIKFRGKSIADVLDMTVEEGLDFFKAVPVIREKMETMCRVGLGYIHIGQQATTLSGGEAQRIRLATQIGSQLVGVLYILDEPSIGLHQKDNERLIQSLCSLRDLGNSVIVVEHDKDMMLKADYLIDMGPYAGKRGGEIIFKKSPQNIIGSDSVTGKYISGELEIPIPSKRRILNGNALHLHGCTGNNLKNVSVQFPLGLMIGVSGVSGSGKSSLINETLYPILNQYIYKGVQVPLGFKKIEGLQHIDKVVDINQSPIGRTPRSNPATYCCLLYTSDAADE